MKADAKIIVADLDETDEVAPYDAWGTVMVLSTILSWAIVIGAAKLVASLI